MKDAGGHGSNTRGGPAHMQGVLKATKPIKVKPGVLSTVQQNPNGFSVTPKGKIPDSGYMVSVPGRTKIVDAKELASARGQQIINDYVRQHSDVLGKSGAHIGGWTDSDTGKTHLDVSYNIKNRNTAIRTGQAHNQIAIWDVHKGREIRTGGTGDV